MPLGGTGALAKRRAVANVTRGRERILSIGIIGLGGVSRFYAGAVRRSPEVSLAAVCDLRADRRAPFADRAEVRAYGDPAALLADPDVQAVIVDTPVATHVALCRAALEARKHVCCEKPLALTRADATELLELAEAEALTLFTAFHRRYNRGMPAPDSLPTEAPVLVQARYYERIEDHSESAAWYATRAAAGGGCIVDNGPNAYDVVRHLFGDTAVTDVTVHRSPEGVDLDAVVRGLAGETEVVIGLDWAYPGEQKDLRARWADGSELYVDMLEGFPGFKSSLDHEYDGVLDDFAAHVADSRQDRHGYAATAWLEDALALAEACP